MSAPSRRADNVPQVAATRNPGYQYTALTTTYAELPNRETTSEYSPAYSPEYSREYTVPFIENPLDESTGRADTSARRAVEDGHQDSHAEQTDPEKMREKVEHLKRHEAHLEERRQNAEELMKRFLGELTQSKGERQKLESKLRERDIQNHLMPPRPGPLDWVNSSWFGGLSTALVIMNLGVMVLQVKGDMSEVMARCLNNMFLLWYCIELTLKTLHYKKELFVGPCTAVWWNWLDLAIVGSGVVDQWVTPLLFGAGGTSHLGALRTLRLFRILRVLKVVKTFLVSDLAWLLESSRFEVGMSSVIAFNAAIMWPQLDIEWCGWVWVDNAFLTIYAFELSLRLKCWGWHFFMHERDWKWNWLDFAIVNCGMLDLWLLPSFKFVQTELFGVDNTLDTSSLKSMMTLARLMRLLRVLRLIRVLRSVPPLYTMLVGVIDAFGAMKWVIILTLITLYGGAIIFTNLVGKGMIYSSGVAPKAALENFGTISLSLYSLFQLMNGDTSVIDPIEEILVGKFLFAGFVVISTWAVLAILTAVVSEKMIASSERFQEEEKQRKDEEKEKSNKQELLALFRKKDPQGTRMINKSTWREMVSDGPTRLELSEGTHLGKDDLFDLFDCLAVDDQPDEHAGIAQDSEKVNYHELVKTLKSNVEPADKRSVAHVMLRLRSMQEQLQKTLNSKLGAVSTVNGPQQSHASLAPRGEPMSMTDVTATLQEMQRQLTYQREICDAFHQMQSQLSSRLSLGALQLPSPDIKTYGEEVPDMPQSPSSQPGSQPRLISSLKMPMRDVTSTPMSHKQDEGVAFVTCKPVQQWTVDDVRAWAIYRQVPSEVVEVLFAHAISGSVLFTLSEHDLATMGISRLGWRRELIAKIREIGLQDAPSSGPISMAAITSTRQGSPREVASLSAANATVIGAASASHETKSPEDHMSSLHPRSTACRRASSLSPPPPSTAESPSYQELRKQFVEEHRCS